MRVLLQSAVERALNRGAREAVTRLGVPPAMCNYRYVPVTDVQSYVHQLDQNATTSCLEEIAPALSTGAPLPLNMPRRADLPRDRGRWRRSFFEIPTRLRRPVSLLTAPSCLMIAVQGDWGLEHFAVLTGEGRRLDLAGMRWHPPHRRAMKARTAVDRRENVFWIWESWYSNYYHWLIRHLPKLLVARDRNWLGQTVVPPTLMPTPFMLESAAAIGVDLLACPRMTAVRLEARQTRVMHYPDLSPALLHALADAVGHKRPLTPSRRIYLSRRKAPRRRLQNEGALLERLHACRFEEVILEDLTFLEQVKVLGDASVVVGVHGAGLANIAFCHPSAVVIEIADSSFPNPDYYDLASALGLRYGVVFAHPVGPRLPGSHDLLLDAQAFSAVDELLEDIFSSTA